MSIEIHRLHHPLQHDRVRLTPLVEADRAALREACAVDPDIWQLYPMDYGPAGFDANFTALICDPARLPFAVWQDETLVGMTAYLRIEPAMQTLEIGNSYIIPAQRGTGLNRAMKTLLIDQAFACGVRRIQFRVDARNGRSQAAVLKLGARQEGLLRAERITWTGHVRDTVLFGMLRSDWQG